MAIFDFLMEPFFGDAPTAQRSGFFPTEDTRGLGREMVEFLRTQLATPAAAHPAFQGMQEALREGVGMIAQTNRQRAGESAVAGGFFDSGALREQLGGIDRGEIQAFAAGVRDILIDLERRRTENVLPFLAQASSEFSGIEQLNVQSQLQHRGQIMDFLLKGAQMGLTAGGVGGFGQVIPPGADNVCWVAEAIYGKRDPRTHRARYYVLFMAPRWLRRGYIRFGRRIAGVVKRSRLARALVKPAFDYMVRRVNGVR